MLQESKFVTGVNTARVAWTNAFNAELACPEIASIPLFWEPAYDEYDGTKSFKNYKQLGGWKIPYSKIYTTTNICGTIFDVIYFE